MNLSKKLILVIAISLLLSVCAHSPAQEMSDARQAIQLAASAGATPEALAKAKQLLQAAEQRLQQAAYGDARRFALDARDEAQRVRLLLNQ